MIEQAWVQFTPAATPTVNCGKNIASVVQTATGNYLITLKDDLPNTRAMTVATLGGMTVAAGSRRNIAVTVDSVSTVRVRAYSETGVLDDPSEITVYLETDADASIGA